MMTDRDLKPAVLSREQLSRVEALEKQLGGDVVVVAYERRLEPAEIAADQVERVKALERELGDVYLVAWKKPGAGCP
jgi:hypothetical protein